MAEWTGKCWDEEAQRPGWKRCAAQCSSCKPQAWRVYVCGPMTGIPQFNFPAFDAAAAALRDLGYDVVSPAEMDDPETRAAALASPDGAPGTGSTNGDTWGDFLARDVKLIADTGIEIIVCIPGWERSRGGRLEVFVGRLCGLQISRLVDGEVKPISAVVLSDVLGAV